MKKIYFPALMLCLCFFITACFDEDEAKARICQKYPDFIFAKCEEGTECREETLSFYFSGYTLSPEGKCQYRRLQISRSESATEPAELHSIPSIVEDICDSIVDKTACSAAGSTELETCDITE